MKPEPAPGAVPSTLKAWLVSVLLATAEIGAVVARAGGPSREPRALFSAFILLQLGAFAACLALLWLGRDFSWSLRRLLREGWLAMPSGLTWVDLVPATLAVLPATLWSLYQTELAAISTFKNQQLALWLLAPAAAAETLIGAIIWLLAVAGCRRFRARTSDSTSRVLLLPALLLGAAVCRQATVRSGIEQLDPWLWATPTAGLLGVIAVTAGSRSLSAASKTPTRTRRLQLVLSAATAASLLVAMLSHDAFFYLARDGAWSKTAIELLRTATDFDGDGYSGWFAGGDCAPFDASIHPGAQEVPLDGVDNNCIAGDGGHRLPFEPPRPAPSLSPGVRRRSNLVLVTIETLRADHVSFLGYPRDTTPALKKLSESSVVFGRSYATTPTTRLSLAALLSGRLPSTIHWLRQEHFRQMRRIANDTPWMPEILAAQGYFTLSVQTNFRAFTQLENAGFDRGFVRYDTSTPLAYDGGTMRGFPGRAQIERALSLLDQSSGRPVFLWVHLVEPHYSYQQSPRVPQFGTDELSLYDAEIAEVDRDLEQLFSGLRARNLFDDSVIVVTGDHGEEFGEHGQRWHGSNLYEPQLHTATLLRAPGLAPGRCEDPVSFVDLAPTLLDLLGIEQGLGQMMGRNLLPYLTGGSSLAAGTFIENFRVDDGSHAQVGLIEWPYKLIHTRTANRLELYDLGHDQGEKRDLYSPSDPLSARLTERLYRYLESQPKP